MTTLLVAISGLAWSTYSTYTKSNDLPASRPGIYIPIDKPWGKSISPAPDLTVPRQFKISGETRNIPDGQKPVLVVDVEKLRLC